MQEASIINFQFSHKELQQYDLFFFLIFEFDQTDYWVKTHFWAKVKFQKFLEFPHHCKLMEGYNFIKHQFELT